MTALHSLLNGAPVLMNTGAVLPTHNDMGAVLPTYSDMGAVLPTYSDTITASTNKSLPLISATINY